MNIQVRLFGLLSETVGKTQLIVDDCNDTQSLKEKIIREYPKLKDCVFMISVDKKLVKNNQTLEAGNEVALLPPFSGG